MIRKFILALTISLSLCSAVQPAGILLLGSSATKNYVFQGGNSIASLGSATSNTIAVTTTSTIASGDLIVVTVGIINQFAATFTSVVFDPAGINLTLTLDASQFTNHCVGLFSGVAGGSVSAGSKNIVITTGGGSVQFQDLGVSVYSMHGLSSNVKITSGSGANNYTISVAAGDFLINSSTDNGTDDFVLSTALPTTIHKNLEAYAADWTIASTNASFLVFPRNGGSGGHAGATYH